MRISVGIADDQLLFMKSLSALIDTFPGFEVVMDGVNGEDLCRKLTLAASVPDILLLDVNMPVMDGPATAAFVAQRFPVIRMVALSMKDDEISIIKMIRAGCCAYLSKDMHPAELEKALQEVARTGYYNADGCHSSHVRTAALKARLPEDKLTAREMEFLQLACSDMTYKQIASAMYLSERTIDGYRESLFEKFQVQSRVGMVMEGLRRELVDLCRQNNTDQIT